MKRLVTAGIITLLATAVCSAEPAPPPSPGGPPPGMADGNRPDAPRRGPPDGDRVEGPRRGPPDGEREFGWHHHHPPMIGMKAAHLRFRRGETGIDFKCAAEDSTKACVDALMPLVDKLLQVR